MVECVFTILHGYGWPDSQCRFQSIITNTLPHLLLDRRRHSECTRCCQSQTETFTKFNRTKCYILLHVQPDISKNPLLNFGLTKQYWSLSIPLGANNSCYTLQESPNLTRALFYHSTESVCWIIQECLAGKMEKGDISFTIYQPLWKNFVSPEHLDRAFWRPYSTALSQVPCRL